MNCNFMNKMKILFVKLLRLQFCINSIITEIIISSFFSHHPLVPVCILQDVLFFYLHLVKKGCGERSKEATARTRLDIEKWHILQYTYRSHQLLVLSTFLPDFIGDLIFASPYYMP